MDLSLRRERTGQILAVVIEGIEVVNVMSVFDVEF